MYIAVDIGGTKTLVAVFDKKGKIIEHIKSPTSKNYTDFLVELENSLKSLKNKEFTRGVIAAPGVLDRKNGIGKDFGNLPWHEVPLEEDLEKILSCPIEIENDANLAALSEAKHLEGKYNKVLYITVSTGIGGGLVIDGRIHPNFVSIEPGWIMLEHEGRFKRWEDFASGSAIVEKFGKLASEITDPKDWYVIARNLAVGFNALIATLTPEVIVIGGGVGSYFDEFRNRLLEELQIFESPLTPVPPIIKAKNPEEAVIYGCYEYAKALDEKNTSKSK